MSQSSAGLVSGPQPEPLLVSSHRGDTGFRPDVEGIRALAVLMVMLYHAKVPGIAGGFVGVDVFFVVSGFLITGLLLREVTVSGRVDLVRFYARRAKRLLPAGTAVLVVTAAASWLLLPASRWPSIATDIAAAAVFVVNWVFAGRATDYLGAEEAASPVQHFWSLSVEEQFYFMWPALLVGFAVLALRAGFRIRRSLLAAMGFVFVPSLAYSVLNTATNPANAYFSTFTRLWEMALGGLVALTAAESSRLPAGVKAALGYMGAVAVISSVVLITPATPFPGTAALLPTLGAAALLLSGMGGGSGWVTRGLSTSVMVWVGAMSYSLYLWHWPAIAIVTELRPAADWRVLIPVTLVGGALAWISLRFLENPVRHAAVFRRRSGLALIMGGVLVVTSLGAAFVLYRASGIGQSEDLGAIPPSELGAARLLDRAWVQAHPDPGDSFDPLVPSAAEAPRDNAAPYSDGCQVGSADAPLQDCQYGDPQAAFELVIAGDSHATSWVPTLTRLAQEHGWGLRTLLKSQCPLTDSTVTITSDDQPYDSCTRWQEAARQRLAADPPDLLLLTSVNYVAVLGPSGQRLQEDQRDDEIRRGFHAVAQEAEAHGTTPVFIADTPLMSRDGEVLKVPDCVATSPQNLSECATPRREAVDDRNPVDRLLTADPAYSWRAIDLTDGICLPDVCPAAVGNVIIYRDYAHLTATYAESMAPWMRAALAPWLPDGGAGEPSGDTA